ncbi:MAG: ROK family protein [Kofleriaceae bacterium]
MILAGDIGGTKTTLALFDDGAVKRDVTVKSGDHGSLEEIIEAMKPGTVTAACFGVAGPVVDGVSKITNLPWTIAASSLEKLVGAPVTLINDLQATAYGMLVIDKFAVLQDGPRPERATIAVVAPGTGFGESLLFHDGKRYHALASEGGHADFAPTSDEEVELLKFLRAKYGEHVSIERVLSGAGIGDLYDFCRGDQPALPYDGDRNAAIGKAGCECTEPYAQRAIEMFVRILGSEAGNHALRGLTIGGVVIGGGIPPKILPALQRGTLVERFAAKGRFHDWARALSVRVALEPRAALYGAAHQASRNHG